MFSFKYLQNFLTAIIFFSTGIGTQFVSGIQEIIDNIHESFTLPLQDHLAAQRLKKFPCPKCPSAFRQKGSLTRHLRFECNQPPRFKCIYCKTRFRKTSNAYDHVRKKHPGYEVCIESDLVD